MLQKGEYFVASVVGISIQHDVLLRRLVDYQRPRGGGGGGGGDRSAAVGAVSCTAAAVRLPWHAFG